MFSTKSRQLTKSRVKHIQCHLVTLLGTSNSDQTLVAILLRLVDLNDTPTEMPDLVDLGSSLADNRTNHIVGDVDLLSQWLTGHHAANRSPSGGAGLSGLGSSVWSGLVRASASICSMWRGTIGHGGLADRGGCGLAMEIGDAICTSCGAVGVRVVSPEGVWVTVLAADWLRNVRDNLHAARNSSSRATATGSVRGSGRSAETIGELLDQSNGDIVGGDVDCIRNTKDYERTLRGQGKTGI